MRALLEFLGERHVAPWLRAFVPALLIVLAFGALVRGHEDRIAEAGFRDAARERLAEVAERVDAALANLRALGAYYDASAGDVSRVQFTRLTTPLLAQGVPIQALEWIPRVRSDQRADFLAQARSDGLAHFAITQREPGGALVPAAGRDDFYPVYYVQPLAGNQKAVGYDVGSNPQRRAALTRAMNTAAMVATERITLVQETSDQYGFLVFRPVYAGGVAPPTAAARRRRLLGFVLAVFRVGDLIEGRHARHAARIRLQVRDDDAPPGMSLLYPKRGVPEALATGADPAWRVGTIGVAGRHWSVSARAAPGAYLPNRSGSTAVFVLGVLAAVLWGFYVRQRALRLASIERAVAQRTEELNEQRQFSAAIFDAVGSVGLVLDRSGAIIRFNKAAEAASGYGFDEVRDRPFCWRQFLPAEQRDGVERVFQGLLDGAAPATYDNDWIGRSGERRSFAWSNAVLRDAAGAPKYLITMGQDISERKRIHRELEHERLRFKTILQTASDGIHVLDAAGLLVEANAAFLDMLGYDARALGHLNVRDWDVGDTWATIDARNRDLLASAGSAVFETRHRHHDGHVLDVEISAKGIRLEGVAYLYAASRDITARKRASAALAASEQRYRQFFEINTAVKLAVDPDSGAIVDANPAAAAFYGYSREQLQSMRIFELNCQSRDEIAREMQRAKAEQRLYFNFRHRLASGETRDVEVYSGPAEVGGRRLVYSIVHDVTERRRAEAQLRVAAGVFESSYEGILITDARGVITDANPALSRITGYRKDEIIGLTPRVFASGRHGPEFYAQMWSALREQGVWSGEVWNRRKSGELYAELLAISAVRDDAGATRQFVGIFSDISVIKQHEDELNRIAYYDVLTGIPNRRLLAERLARAVVHQQRSTRQLAVCYLDLDGFKPVNDRYGHEAGDRLLLEIGARLDALLRANDTVARLGGDEFVLLLADLLDVDECTAIVERVLAAVARPVDAGGVTVSVSASVGIAMCPPDEPDADTLLRHADQAMYRAKESGRGRYHLFDAQQDKQVRLRRQRLQQLRRALDEGQFELYYQPKVDLLSGEVFGVEALIRWHHPDEGLLAPAAFLDFLGGTEMELELGGWVLEHALRQMGSWQQGGWRGVVSVNVSAPQLLQPDFAERLRAALQRHPEVAADLLELEILESAALGDIVQAERTMRECRRMGVRFALDDFGTGYASLHYFRKLPVEMLKIDQSFVTRMLEDASDLEIVDGVVRLAQAFHHPVIAEGVETLEHGAMLLLLGCRRAQGFGIARPMPAAAFASWRQHWQGQGAWRDGARPPERADLPLGVAARIHRAWCEDVAAAAGGARNEREAGLDLALTRFGHWYRTVGGERYGALPGFSALGKAHERLHQLGGELLTGAQSGGMVDVRERVAELYAELSRFLARLDALSAQIHEAAHGRLP